MRIETITDECPIHNAETKHEYTFGQFDATVLVYGCGCCAAYKDDGFLGGRLFNNYKAAASYATLAKIQSQFESRSIGG